MLASSLTGGDHDVEIYNCRLLQSVRDKLQDILRSLASVLVVLRYGLPDGPVVRVGLYTLDSDSFAVLLRINVSKVSRLSIRGAPYLGPVLALELQPPTPDITVIVLVTRYSTAEPLPRLLDLALAPKQACNGA